jgi:integrase
VSRRSKHAEKGAAAVETRLLALAEKELPAEDAIRIHDLRRTLGSWMAASGEGLPVIGAVLGHSNPSTTQIYARLQDDAKRAALEAHGARIGPLLSAGGGA